MKNATFSWRIAVTRMQRLISETINKDDKEPKSGEAARSSDRMGAIPILRGSIHIQTLAFATGSLNVENKKENGRDKDKENSGQKAEIINLHNAESALTIIDDQTEIQV